MSDTAVDKVEEVDLDALEDEPAHDAKAKAQAQAQAPHDAGPSAAGSTTVELVRPEELAQTIPLPEIETNAWLVLAPLLVVLLVLWNVDWKDARVQRETAARRKSKQPLSRKPA